MTIVGHRNVDHVAGATIHLADLPGRPIVDVMAKQPTIASAVPGDMGDFSAFCWLTLLTSSYT
ncbi:MAG TPA: hypothetical protein QF611_04550 [Pseudomonadales bacterium]|nr:hypothetical protein [Pseudomonadales bacterium]